MCNFCENKEKQISRYCSIGIEYNTPFTKSALVVSDLKKGCPKHADCCSKDVNVNADFIIYYCPICGKKLQ